MAHGHLIFNFTVPRFTSSPENVLKVLKVSDVDELKRMIKAQFNISENVTLRSESDNLKDSKLVTELYNTEDKIIVEGKGMHNIVISKLTY
jgi:hypothetical protein